MNEAPRYPQLLVDVPPAEADDVAALLFELGADGVEERDESTLAGGAAGGKTTLVASFATHALAETAAADMDAAFSARITELVGDAWRDEWKKYFVPFRLTDRVTIRPPWQAYTPTQASELVLELEPGRAFGTGLHPTTALVARAIESLAPEVFARAEGTSTVLDVGTGSGILALIALLLGAGRTRAIDVDPDAVALTVENARRNDLANRLDADVTPVGSLTETYDLVVANIEATVLIDLAAALTARVRPGGYLVLSGILSERAADVRTAFAHLHLTSSSTQGEWTALVFKA
jgi:ribosomal protein L11 methyltransferase